ARLAPARLSPNRGPLMQAVEPVAMRDAHQTTDETTSSFAWSVSMELLIENLKVETPAATDSRPHDQEAAAQLPKQVNGLQTPTPQVTCSFKTTPPSQVPAAPRGELAPGDQLTAFAEFE